MQRIINERRSGQSKSTNETDLLTILIGTELFCRNDDFIIDEIITFFFAGMKTIQTTTANLMYYLEKD